MFIDTKVSSCLECLKGDCLIQRWESLYISYVTFEGNIWTRDSGQWAQSALKTEPTKVAAAKQTPCVCNSELCRRKNESAAPRTPFIFWNVQCFAEDEDFYVYLCFLSIICMILCLLNILFILAFQRQAAVRNKILCVLQSVRAACCVMHGRRLCNSFVSSKVSTHCLIMMHAMCFSLLIPFACSPFRVLS